MARHRLRFRHLAAAAPLLAALLVVAPCAAQGVDEGELKAAIVYNILLFVEWPPAMMPPPGGALSLCVGPHSADAAMQALDRRELRGFHLSLRELGATASVPPCHAVFVDAADRQRLAAGVKAQRAAGALVLSDDPDAPAESTAIVLRRVGTRITFEVNLQPLRQAGIQLSSKLLRLAKTVRE
ncbi:YfiR family protein [Piscinibacter sp. XHJ-5]|uniref:YfiR family protein n=1 Tax=Piscinibacter sp. XHJ-5 TaxID=3037797 RepID=UPI002452F9EC|nr:YfiR family protein [Piscinibacter sp. XHJ-5]